MPPRWSKLALPGVLLCTSTFGESPAPLIARAEFLDRRDPPAHRQLDAATRESFDLGLLVFNTPWLVANSPNAARRDGLGPLFVSTSCDACHNNGARGRAPARAGELSNSFVMQLTGINPYGAVLNTAAVPDHMAEGRISVRWQEIHGQYADGTRWTLRQPLYSLQRLVYGSPRPGTVLRPRIAPAVFGVGLLERVPEAELNRIRVTQPASARGWLAPGRFGWMADSVDVEDQTARAFAREIGVTSRTRMADDCSPAQIACRNAPHGGEPEVSDEFMQAVLTLQRETAVPARRELPAATEAAGRKLFSDTGCESCHASRLSVSTEAGTASIDPYSDLLLHELGPQLDDRTQDGQVVTTLWRTAPLWGLAHALKNEAIALMHDGRAASIEEAILWHGGQAESARGSFLKLPADQRRLLVEWVGSL